MIKMFKHLNKKQVFLLLIAVVLVVTQSILDLRIPDFMQDITKLLQDPAVTINEILKPGSYMLLCAIGSLACAIVVGYCASYIGTSFAAGLRSKIFKKVNSFGMEEIRKFSTSSLITRTTNDVMQVRTFMVMSIQMLVKAPVMASIAISKIANKGVEFSIVTAIGVFVVLCTIIFLVLLVLPKFKIIQKLTDNLNKITRENLNGIRVVRAYNAEEYQLNKFEKANDELTKTDYFISKSMAFMSPVMSTVMSGLSLAIYWLGAYLINGTSDVAEKITLLGNLVTFSSYAVHVIMSFIILVVIFILYPRATVSAGRINEVLETKNSMEDGDIDKDTTSLRGEVEFKNVSFKYPDAEEYILENISFKARKGDTVAFIGSTGSGKSTLINLIPRFYDVTSGEVLIDGINVKDMKRSFLNDKLGYISQKAIMFKGSIRENISFGKSDNGKKPKEDIIKKSIEVAQAEDFVSELDGNIDYEVAQGGTNLSGGQKQRLSIARAIARNPEIYIFDDSFSALDYKTDFSLRKAIKSHAKDATVLIVAQRIGTIKDADLIVVLDDGKVVGSGKHKDLLKNCEVYKEIAESQLSKEEIARA